MFDWDDNILHMPTKIHMIHNGVPQTILPGLFAKIRKDSGWTQDNDAFIEFRDNGPRGNWGFIDDIQDSIQNKSYGPCWNSFISAIVEGEIVIIITARGHAQKTLRSGVKYIIENCLSPEDKLKMSYNIVYLLGLFKDDKYPLDCLVDRYLDYCMFMGVYSDDFEETFGIRVPSNNPELAKEMIADYYLKIINKTNKKLGYSFTIGMSDDDKGNVQQIKMFFKRSNYSNAVGMYVYDTSNPKKIIKTEIKNLS